MLIRSSLMTTRYFVFSLLVFAAVLFASQTAKAELANSSEMDQVCSNWLKFMVQTEGNWAGSTEPGIAGKNPIANDKGIIIAYCYDIEPRGFVVVPALKDLPPVKMYSDENNLDIDEYDGMAKLARDVLNEKTAQFEEYYGSLEAVQPEEGTVLIDRIHRTQWDQFTKSAEEFLNSQDKGLFDAGRNVGPLLTTTWEQGYPYNMYCPTGDGGRTVVGCVATAAAQIIWYWQWPPAGEGQHSYYWGGDNSCDGSSAGGVLSADYSDGYQYVETGANVAELSYEVGVAFNMDYGYCGSGAYTSDAVMVFPTYFRYRETINRIDRSSYTATQWFYAVQNEINAGRPMQYRINLHSIVCDGWRISGSYNQFHMNYGWGGSNNAWYVIDGLHCPWAGCSPSVEYMIRGIEPDMGVMVYADTSIGEIPLLVEFTGASEFQVDTWIWNFGDGKADTGQTPSNYHTYEEPGVYDVTLTAIAGTDTSYCTRDRLIVAVADSLKGGYFECHVGDTVEIVISGNNTLSLNSVKIPVDYGGDIELEFLGISTDGCRTDYFENVANMSEDPDNYRFTTHLQTAISGGGVPNLETGSGPLLKARFRVLSGLPGSQNNILLNGYYSHVPSMSDGVITYHPETVAGTLVLIAICGDVNSDNTVNILDIVELVNYKFKSGAAPNPLQIADVNHDTVVNILDIVYLINYKFKGGPVPQCE